MADMRTYFGAIMLLALATLFVASLYSQSIQNGGYSDVGPDGKSNFPLAGQTSAYMAQINQSAVQLTNSMNTTLGQSNSIDLTGSLGATFFTAGAAMSIIWSSFMMVISMFTTIILAPIATSLGVSVMVAAIGLAYVAGLVLLVVAGVVFKWFI